MRLLILISLLLLPQWLRAQSLFSSYQPGIYYLANSRVTQYKGQLEVLSNELKVRDAQGVVTRYKPDEVYYIRLAGRTRYMPVSGFLFNNRPQKPTLVEVLDSGRVMLFRYVHSSAAPVAAGPGGAMAGGTRSTTVFMLQRLDEASPVSLPLVYAGYSNKEFREALRPYVEGRPELEKLLDAKQVSTRNLAAFIHALNTGQPFQNPSADN